MADDFSSDANRRVLELSHGEPNQQQSNPNTPNTVQDPISPELDDVDCEFTHTTSGTLNCSNHGVVQETDVDFIGDDPENAADRAKTKASEANNAVLEFSSGTVEKEVLGKTELGLSQIEELGGFLSDVATKNEAFVPVGGNMKGDYVNSVKFQTGVEEMNENIHALGKSEVGTLGNQENLGLVVCKEEMNNVLSLGKGEVGNSGNQENLGLVGRKEEMKGVDGSVKCALKIEVIDDTAMIEASLVGKGSGRHKDFVGMNVESGRVGMGLAEVDAHKRNSREGHVGKKEKRPRRRGKGGKMGSEIDGKGKNLICKVECKAEDWTHIAENMNICGVRSDGGKRMYTRKEMEALRFVNLEGQRKKWIEVYCGLGPVVQGEYDTLVECNSKKHICIDFDPRPLYKKAAHPANLGGMASRGRGNYLKVFVH